LGGSVYVEISASLVIGTSAGTAYEGSSGAQNALDIAGKQDQFGTTTTGGLQFVDVGATSTLQIDMTKSTLETSFDDDEIMLIEKTTGALCRITKQQLQSSINTNTTYNNGTNISIDTNNHINLNSDISTNSVETKTDLVLRTQVTNNADYLNSILFQNTGSFYNIALTRRYDSSVGSNKSNFCIQTGANGYISGLPVRLCVQNNGNINIGSSQTKTHAFNVEGSSNFENSITATSFIGPLTGNASTSTKIDSITNSDIVQLTSVQTLTNKSLTSPTISGL
jgi:hypothetical protein